MNSGGKRTFRTVVADEGGQAMTEYVILTMFVTVVCVFLLDPEFTFPGTDQGIYFSLRRMYDFIGNGLCLPGP